MMRIIGLAGKAGSGKTTVKQGPDVRSTNEKKRETAMANDINTLRDALFATLRGLQDRDNPIETERARAINETAQTIINSAKLEIEHMRVAGSTRGTDFIPCLPSAAVDEADARNSTQLDRRTHSGLETVTAVPGGAIRRHMIR